MLVQEALHEKEIGNIAEQIASSKEVRVVTIAGPSSSGKTTFSYRLSAQLKTFGLKPHPIGLDDYFVNRVDTPKAKTGNTIMNVSKLSIQSSLTKIWKTCWQAEKYMLPTYNFITGKREYNKPMLKLGPDEILVIEGIHGLNDKLTEKIPKKISLKYISVH